MDYDPARGAEAPTFLRLALKPLDEVGKYIAINIQAIQRIDPPAIAYRVCPDGTLLPNPPTDLRYSVTFRLGDQVKSGYAEEGDLVTAGLPLPQTNTEPIAPARHPEGSRDEEMDFARMT